MKIYIRNEEGRGFTIPLPLFMIKSRLLWSLVEKHAGSSAEDETALAEEGGGVPAVADTAAQYYPIAREVCAELSAYVRTHGHFVLVDVQSADGECVKIVV